jgi:tetratricopeptide (TPR) repeat protein
MSIEDNALDCYLIGVEEFKKGNLDLALYCFAKSICLEPHFKTYQKKSEVLEKLGKEKEAFVALEEAYMLNPMNDSVAFNYASKLFKMNRFDECIAILKTIIERNSSYGPARKLLQSIG